MGSVVSSFKSLFDNFGGGDSKHRILLIGLDAAGKTTLLYKMKIGEQIHTIPTIGFNVEDVKFKNVEMTIWDVGGQDSIRKLWRHYYTGTSAVVFMVDSADDERLEEASKALHDVLDDDILRNAVLLVFANKQDLPKARSVADIAESLGLTSMSDRKWHCQACSATVGDGIFEGFEWLSQTLKKHKVSSKV